MEELVDLKKELSKKSAAKESKAPSSPASKEADMHGVDGHTLRVMREKSFSLTPSMVQDMIDKKKALPTPVSGFLGKKF